MEGIYFEITIIIAVAAVLTILFRIIKQPPVLAYILTGIILGPLGLLPIEHGEDLSLLGQVGITLLLFLLGLELKLRELRSIGKTAIIGGSIQVITTFILGMLLAMALGFTSQIAMYIGIGLSFSSTIIIVKLLSDKKDLTSMYGRLAVGILLMQDFFAVMTIIFLTGLTPGAGVSALIPDVGFVLVKVVALFAAIIFLSKYVFPKIVSRISHSSESLFLFSLAWVFVLTAIVTSPLIGFSIEIGGFLAGLALANTTESFQIVARMKSLRDFFITLFFVMLGLEMTFSNIGSIIFPAFILILFIILIKPIIVMATTGLLGYRKRTSFFTGLSLSQISEFSLIIFFIGNAEGAIPDEIITLGVLVALVSFVTSTYFILNQNVFYEKLKKYLGVFEKKHVKNENIDLESEIGDLKDHTVVVGAHQMGQSIVRALEQSGYEVLIVDFDPMVVRKLRDKDFKIFFGDIADPEIQERARLEFAKLVISTVPDVEDNLLLIQKLKHDNKKAKVIVMAYETDDAKVLYKAGADYVILPHVAGGRHIAKILVDEKHMEMIEAYKAKDLSLLG